MHPKQGTGELRVVVVDDSEFSRKSIISVLESEKVNVVGEAESADKAIQLLGTVKANLFLIDVVMPGVSGLQIAKLVAEKGKGALIIMISSLSSEHVIIEAISNGAIDFIQKPFERETLIDSIRKAEAILKENGKI